MATSEQRSTTINTQIASSKERLSKRLSGFFVLAPIISVFIITLSTQTAFKNNNKIGFALSDYYSINKPTPYPKRAIFINVSKKGDINKVSFENKKNFFFKEKNSDLTKIESHLRKTINKRILFALLLKKTTKEDLTVVFTAEKDLRFASLKPLLFLLAKLGVSSYAIEAKV